MLFRPAPIAFLMSATFLIGGNPVDFRTIVHKPGDSVEVRTDKVKAIFAVKSTSGIGRAFVERNGKEWPATVYFQLHLKGLESFRISVENATLDVAVSSADGKARIWKDGKEDAPLDAKNPFWTEIRMLSSDGRLTTSIPLRDGSYFELELPKPWLEANPKSIALNWIDFFRN